MCGSEHVRVWASVKVCVCVSRESMYFPFFTPSVSPSLSGSQVVPSRGHFYCKLNAEQSPFLSLSPLPIRFVSLDVLVSTPPHLLVVRGLP